MTSPTQRSLALLRSEGWLVAVVERWCSHTHRRYDLFGMFDLLAIKGVLTLGVQCTSGSNHVSRVKKLLDSECYEDWLQRPFRAAEVHSWKKYAKPVDRKYWRVRREAL